MLRYSWIVFSIFIAVDAYAAGYEKATVWSGKHAGRGAAVVGDVNGSQALFFNPAGLADMPTAAEISLNFSPTLSKFEGPRAFQNNAGAVEGRQVFSPVAGITGGYQVNNDFGIGAGVFVSGGTKARFTDLDYSTVSGGAPYTLKPTVETDLSITEASIGAGYEVMPGLRLGVAWRYVMVRANFALVGAPSGLTPQQALINVSANELEANRWNAFRLGAQWTPPGAKYGFGFQFRSPVKFTATGSTSGRFDSAAPSTDIEGTGGPVDVSNTFPLQVTLGGYNQWNRSLRFSAEYAFMNYAENKTLDINGNFTIPGVGTAVLNDIDQSWNNQHTFRVGVENQLMDRMMLRGGYTLTTPTTPKDRAKATFSSPGLGHILNVGLGDTFLNDRLDIDAALEYVFSSGKGTNPTASELITTEKEYSSNAYAIHLGTTYRF